MARLLAGSGVGRPGMSMPYDCALTLAWAFYARPSPVPGGAGSGPLRPDVAAPHRAWRGHRVALRCPTRPAAARRLALPGGTRPGGGLRGMATGVPPHLASTAAGAPGQTMARSAVGGAAPRASCPGPPS